LITAERRANVLRGLFASWTAGMPPGATLFDKLICTVRSVAAIMDSIKRLARRDPTIPSFLFSDDERASIYTRTEALSQRLACNFGQTVR
jgi:hypothetical protein